MVVNKPSILIYVSQPDPDYLREVCAGIEEEKLKEQIELLKEDMKEHAVVMAVGAVWKKNGGMNIDRLLTESERLMYEDKAAYYRTLGEDRTYGSGFHVFTKDSQNN